MVRTAHGRFVRNDNPLAVITRLNAAKAEREAREALATQRQRRAAAARHGYRGPLTRAELAATVAS